jgi:hypothetical protein
LDLRRDYDIIQFTILILKCFLILVFFGIILPWLVDYMFFYVSRGAGDIYNSVFVYNSYNNKSVVRNFVVVFRKYITY